MSRFRPSVNNVFNINVEQQNAQNQSAGPSAESSQSDMHSYNSQFPLTTATTITTADQRSSADSNQIYRSHSFDNNVASPNQSRGDVRRWSQTLHKGAKAGTIRQRTINYLPSRMLKAIAVNGQILTNHETEVDGLMQEIEQHDHLMEDNAISEQLRIDTLRALPQSLTMKRIIKSKLTRSVINKSHSRKIGRWKRYKYDFGMWANRTKTSINNTINNIELWYDSMKQIEGHFGSGVSTYFKFLRWLFTLNLVQFVLSFGFIIVPQLIFDSMEKDQAATSNITAPTAIPFEVLDIFTANGSFRNTILFYGAYANGTFRLTPQHGQYNITNAYFMTMLCLYVGTFIMVSISMARSYRKSFIETSGGGLQNMYAHKVFCSWDFGIATEKAALLKHNSILNEFREILNELNTVPLPKSKLYYLWTVSSQITAHLIIFGMIAGLGFGMWSLLSVINDDSSSFAVLYVPLVVNFTILILQVVFSWISFMEEYKSQRITLHITLMRNFVLEVVIVGVLVTFWLTRPSKTRQCWETSIGQEIYRLVLIDFLVFGLGSALYHCIRFLLYKYAWPQIGLPEFDISRGSLGLILNQTLLWVGLLFSPLLSAVIIIKMITTFYIRKTTLIYFCKPPSKLWRSAQTSTLFLVMTFLSLIGVIVILGFITTQVEVSNTCGPFRHHENMIDAFFDILALQEDHVGLKAITFFLRPGVVFLIILAMSCYTYYLSAKSKSRVAMVRLLKDLLYLESKDKEFLLSKITQVTHGKEWLFDDINVDDRNMTTADQFAESSSTWNYRNHDNIAGPSLNVF